ncbi:patatin-like phospholipase domain-containing protein 2 [Centropristis striata]|uniref:patatin-like phospholipase domain-containing protein 2 n=1 Tax=Centropristis striata TaxID=184440 RepID=UPI0027E03E51|nr:patatin-like phospholipase domain-containing protein 2 [Centropristis striata]
MLDLQTEWSISFAGCGFMGIYYVGACSCILEKFPRFIQDASSICGSSAGALMAAVLTVGIPLEKCCADLMFMAKEARKHKLGPLHPTYNLIQIVQDSLQACLPEDAHLRASGKLCVSLTRVPDGKNVLVSEFNSRDELIEALVCSCFVPFYCGVIPPTYRGVHYVDGAASDNLPQSQQRNTTTVSAYAGESDLCPRGSVLNFHQVRFNNVSIQVNSENMYRVTSTFFPPPPQAMAEICNNGYMDALRFLQENNLISTECPMRSLEPVRAACCDVEVNQQDEAEGGGVKPPEEDHCWLDHQLIENLPVHIKQALCAACRETQSSGGLLSHVSSYLQLPRALPVQSAFSLAQRLVDWIPDVPRNMKWLYGLAGGQDQDQDQGTGRDSESSLCRSTSLPSDLNLFSLRDAPSSSQTAPCSSHGELHHLPLTPPPTPTASPAPSTESPQGSGLGPMWSLGLGPGLGRAVGWIRNAKKTEDSSSFSALK